MNWILNKRNLIKKSVGGQKTISKIILVIGEERTRKFNFICQILSHLFLSLFSSFLIAFELFNNLYNMAKETDRVSEWERETCTQNTNEINFYKTSMCLIMFMELRWRFRIARNGSSFIKLWDWISYKT
jgi:hypothetical protein